MRIYIITCSFNTSQMLIDCAFKSESEAKAYAEALNNDKTKAIARCEELIAQCDGEEMLKFLNKAGIITFDVVAVEMK